MGYIFYRKVFLKKTVLHKRASSPFKKVKLLEKGYFNAAPPKWRLVVEVSHQNHFLVFVNVPLRATVARSNALECTLKDTNEATNLAKRFSHLKLTRQYIL